MGTRTMPILRDQTRQRREKLRDLTRQEILTAAARVFARGGLESATMHDLAEAAGFGAASLYTYFKSKEAIYAALLEQVSAALDEPLDDDVDGKRPLAERLEQLLVRQLEVMAQNLDTVALLLRPSASAGSAEAQKRLRDVGMPHMLARFEAWVKAHSTAKERGNVPPRRLVLSLVGVGQLFVMDHMAQRRPEPLAGLARLIVEQTLYGTLGRPA